jgi:putative ABC transport system permease protein
MFLLSVIAATAVALSALGIYGVLAYSVSQRRQELGIRMALGAYKAQIQLLVVRHGLALTIIGIAVGLTAVVALTRVLASLLYKTGGHDFITFAATPLGFLVIALLYQPGRPIRQIQPRPSDNPRLDALVAVRVRQAVGTIENTSTMASRLH